MEESGTEVDFGKMKKEGKAFELVVLQKEKNEMRGELGSLKLNVGIEKTSNKGHCLIFCKSL